MYLYHSRLNKPACSLKVQSLPGYLRPSTLLAWRLGSKGNGIRSLFLRLSPDLHGPDSPRHRSHHAICNLLSPRRQLADSQGAHGCLPQQTVREYDSAEYEKLFLLKIDCTCLLLHAADLYVADGADT